MTGAFRGYDTYIVNRVCYFSDTGEPTIETWKARPCGHCGLHNTPEDHDACIANLPGVMNACCGHGRTSAAYIQFPDGSTINGPLVFKWVEQV